MNISRNGPHAQVVPTWTWAALATVRALSRELEPTPAAELITGVRKLLASRLLPPPDDGPVRGGAMPEDTPEPQSPYPPPLRPPNEASAAEEVSARANTVWTLASVESPN